METTVMKTKMVRFFLAVLLIPAMRAFANPDPNFYVNEAKYGGPYPATTDPRSTSVGTAAIKRFARPVCYQNFPQEALPVERRDENERGIWRLVNNRWLKT